MTLKAATKLLIDGISFQLQNAGIAQIWHNLIPCLVAHGELQIHMLDRGQAPKIEGVTYIPFPTNSYKHCADDSILIQKICDHYEIDCFTSTYYTTPLSTPMLLMVHDMTPELSAANPKQREWMERDTAICFAQRYMCLSENTRHDLLSFYPEISAGKTTVAYCGIEESEFGKRVALEQFIESAYREQLADVFVEQLNKLVGEAQRGEYADYFKEWRRLREIQATVDY